jgi:PEP-CTERM motif
VFPAIVGALFLLLAQILLADVITNSGVALGFQSSPRLVISHAAGAEDMSASASVWTNVTLHPPSEFTAAATLDEGDPYLAARFRPADLNGMPDETPPGNKVPEPASLMLVGTGLLAVARVSRMKKPRWRYAGSASSAIGCAVPR